MITIDAHNELLAKPLDQQLLSQLLSQLDIANLTPARFRMSNRMFWAWVDCGPIFMNIIETPPEVLAKLPVRPTRHTFAGLPVEVGHPMEEVTGDIEALDDNGQIVGRITNIQLGDPYAST